MKNTILDIETYLLGQVFQPYIDEGEGTRDDEEFFKAFSAVQDLRLYLEKKEGAICMPG